MKLSTTIADFKGYVKTWPEAIQLFEGTGFRYLDFDFYSSIHPGDPFLSDNWMKEVDAAGEAAAKLGFTFIQAHSPQYNPQDERVDHETRMLALRRSIAACGYLGIPNLVVHSGMSGKFPDLGNKKAYFEMARKFHESLFPLMEKHNVNVLIENIDHVNARENYYFHTAEDMVEFIEFCNHPLLHACWDVGHANVDGRDQYQEICKLGSHLRGVHIQDNFGKHDDHIAPFLGVLNLDAVMHGLLDSGYQGYFNFETLCFFSHHTEDNNPRFPSESISDTRLLDLPVEVRRQAEALLYEIGKHILTQYDCFEE